MIGGTLMKAVALTRYLKISDPESLQDVEIEVPTPGPRDLLVRVEAVSVNPVDVKVRSPKAKVEAKPRVLGWDAAGVVESVGKDVTLFSPGDAVYYAGDITRPGSNQQFQCVDERIVGKKPHSLTFAEAAALPLTALTAYETLFDRLAFDVGGKHAEQTVLIVGGAGGVGSIAIQLAKLAKLRVIATASREESRDWVRLLGADASIDHTRDLESELKTIGVREVDAVAIFNSTDQHLPKLPSIVKAQGRIASIVETSRPVELGAFMSKSLTFSWELMFTRPMYQTTDMIEQHRLLSQVADWIDRGRIRTTLSASLTPIRADKLREAHAMLESGHTVGKVVLSGWD
jgi:zinc-binding alcohol dehydrogenase family protein